MIQAILFHFFKYTLKSRFSEFQFNEILPEVKQLVFFLGNFGRCEHSFRVQVKKFFEKKKKNYNLKTVYDKHSIDF